MAENDEDVVASHRTVSAKEDNNDVAHDAFKVDDDEDDDDVAGATEEEDEDGSHKRKYINEDDELRSDVSPVRKKLFSKTEDPQQCVRDRGTPRSALTLGCL